MAKSYTATLKRGDSYTLKGVKFEHGVSRKINEDAYLHLKEHAVDETSTDDGERLVRQKFVFAEVEATEGDEDDPNAKDGNGSRRARGRS